MGQSGWALAGTVSLGSTRTGGLDWPCTSTATYFCEPRVWDLQLPRHSWWGGPNQDLGEASGLLKFLMKTEVVRTKRLVSASPWRGVRVLEAEGQSLVLGLSTHFGIRPVPGLFVWVTQKSRKPGSQENFELDECCFRINWGKVFTPFPYKSSATV